MITREYRIPDGKFGTYELYKILMEKFPTATPHPTAKTPGVYKIPGGYAVTTCRRLVTFTRK